MATSSSSVPSFDHGKAYWESQDATVTGVMGGFGEETVIPRLDAISNRLLLLKTIPELSTITPVHWPIGESSPKDKSHRQFQALDCGAGVGRVTESTLLPLFDHVDLVEPVHKFVSQVEKDAAARSGGWRRLDDGKSIRVFKEGLQFFDFGQSAPFYASNADASAPPFMYDVVWIQWCIGHLSDTDLVAFLARCKAHLKHGAYVFLKENIASGSDNGGQDYVFDEADSSNTRSDKVFRALFADAGLHVAHVQVQDGFPEEIFQVNTYVLTAQ